MRKKSCSVLLLFVLVASQCSALSATSYLDKNDVARLKNVILGQLPAKDLATLYGSSISFSKLDISFEDQLDHACQLVKSEAEKAVKVEDLFYIAKSSLILPQCGVTADSRIQEVLSSSIPHVTSVGDLYYLVEALATFNISIPVDKIQPILDRLLKQDDSVQSLGYAFHIAARFPGNVDQYFDRIEDAVVQADMVDNKFYQFEGGLSVTALVISGIFELSQKANRKPELNPEQVVGFGEYLISRKTVRPPKSIAALLTALEHLTTNPYFVPVVISLSSKPVISTEHQTLKIRICDLLGNDLQVAKAAAKKIVSVAEKAEVKSNVDLTTDGNEFSLTLSADELGAGFYTAEISADVGEDSRLIGAEGSAVAFKVVKNIAVVDVEVGTGEVDQTTATRLRSVKASSRLDETLEVDIHQRLVIKFGVQEASSKESFTAQQAFIRLVNEEQNHEVFLVADRDSKGSYKVEMDLKAKAKEFDGISGQYDIEIIVGDALATTAISWNIASAKITVEPVTKTQESESFYLPKKEIKHMFREPEKRPPAIVSNVFTAIVVGLFAAYLVAILRLGGNNLKFPIPHWSLGFNLCLLSIFVLYTLFWVKLDMFETLKYLSILGGVTFLVGHKFLSHPLMSQS